MNDSEAHPSTLSVPQATTASGSDPAPTQVPGTRATLEPLGTTASTLEARAKMASGPAAAGAQTRARRAARLAPFGAALLLGVVSLLLPISWSGLWAPHELEIADLSRRIAVALHGAADLAIAGGNDEVPTLSELGKGQLPFTSVAVGFQLLGLSDWAGRLPIALWALCGAVATCLLVARFSGRVTAAYAGCVLVTLPLYFLQARTLLGDGVTLAAVALASAGLALAVFDPRVTRPSLHLAWLSLGVLGVIAGFTSRGLLLGVACPVLGVGLSWAIWRSSGRPCPSRRSDVTGGAALALGALALGVGSWVLLEGSPALYLELLGARSAPLSKLPTHDAVVHQLGFGLYPWSAVAPFALALALLQPDGDAKDAPLRICLVAVFGVAVLVHGLSAPYIGRLPFVGTFAVGGLIALGFRDAETRGAHTRLLALSTAALMILFHADLREAPEQALAAFSIAEARFPESFAAEAKRWIEYGSLASLAVLLVALWELPQARGRRLFDAESDYARWFGWLRSGGRGRLPWVLAGVTLTLALLPLLLLLEARGVSIPVIGSLGAYRGLARYAFLVIPVSLALPVAFWLARDLLGLLLAILPVPPARLAFASLTAFGLALSLGYYPALAAHLSPRNVFESFQERAKPGDALAVLGQAARVAPYYAEGEVHTPGSARAGLDWLLESREQRRFLVLAARDLGQLNHLYRERVRPPDNLPILDATSSEVLLASNRLGPGEVNENPLDRWVSAQPPEPERPLDGVVLEDQLRCLGWGIVDVNGAPVDVLRTGVPYDFKIYWEVLSRISGSWQTFIHIDGHRRRHNGDHETLQGKYPFRFWRQGDFITDVHRFELEPHFAGASYQAYFGLFSGNKRLEVESGRHHDNRIIGGNLTVQ